MNSRPSPLMYAGLAIVAVFSLVALLAPVIAPHHPRALTGEPLEPPSARHLLGTNDIGQDIFSAVLWGARQSLQIGVSSGLLIVAIGVIIGSGAALLGGFPELVLSRIVDIFFALPLFPLLILLAALAGTSKGMVIAAIALISWPIVARLARSQTLTLRKRGFVQAAKGFGAGPLYLIRRHLAPALGPMIVTGFAALAGGAVLLEAGLAFLGLGDPTGVSWGLILNRALRYQALYISGAWTWWVLPTGIALTLTILGFTFIGIALDPRFNPRSRERIW